MFKTVQFRGFKSLRDFTIDLRPINVLVGPNNAGKSTVLDAFRVLMVAHSHASRHLPQYVNVDEKTIIGYEIPISQIPISLTNIHSDYHSDQETSVTFTLDNANELRLDFYENSRCVLTLGPDQYVPTTDQFKTTFPVSIYSIPTLGPFEEKEVLLSDDVVRQTVGTRQANRIFRNIWYRWRYEFPFLQQLVEQTWEGMTISPPELDTTYPPSLSMFCTEGRVDREIYWAGFGFQVWLQLLTHIGKSEEASVLVVDEPEIYLHADLQHKLFQLLKKTDKQIILATHSAELINEAEHDDVLIINKAKKSANRVADIAGLQEALFSIGSAQNIHLARLSRGRKVLFLEGNDFRLIRRLALRLGFLDLSEGNSITVVPIGGFGQRQRIQNAAWTFEKVLKADIAISALLDRDYRCREEIEELIREAREVVPHFNILPRKEIENYLLVPSAIARAITGRLRERNSLKKLQIKTVEKMIDTIASDMKTDVLSQYVGNRLRYFGSRTSKDASTVAHEAIALLDEDWVHSERRLMVVPGKQLLSALNTELEKTLGVSITTAQIINALTIGEIPIDLRNILSELNDFARNPPPGAGRPAAHVG